MKKAQKIEMVRLMHEIMTMMNNENAYMSWIYTMPDCPTEEDFEDFASDNDSFNDLVDAFFRIYKHYRKDGIYDEIICKKYRQ